MTILRRFYILVAVAALGLAVAILIGIVQTRRLYSDVQSIDGDSVKPLQLLSRLDNALLVTRVQALAGQMHDPASPLSKLHDHPVDMHRGALAKAAQTLREAAAELQAMAQHPGAPTVWGELAAAVLAYEQQVVQRSDALLGSGGWWDVAELITKTNGRYTLIKQQLDAAIAQANAQAQQHVQAAAARAQRATVKLAVVGLVAAGVLAVVVLMALRALRRSVATAELLSRRLQALELLPVPEADCSHDEIGRLCLSLNAAIGTLAQTFDQLRGGAEAVLGAASEIAASNHALSQRTETQASNLQRTASATEQISATVQNTAEVARQAHELAASATSAADEGRQATTQVVQTMGEIAERSRRIGEIIGTIDSIAFQTNILALNAAVEAARAGEQGRGFAVVAAEVRQLAQRSAQAAGEIKRMIEDSSGTVERGVAQVQQAGQTILQLVDRVQAVGSLIDQIAQASTEQAAGVKLMTGAVQELEGVTQQNAAMVEQAAAAAENLREQARQVDAALARFRLAAAV